MHHYYITNKYTLICCFSFCIVSWRLRRSFFIFSVSRCVAFIGVTCCAVVTVVLVVAVDGGE